MQSIVVIGAGHLAGQLVSNLRMEGWQGSIKVIGDEPHIPYQRPPLSKQYLKGEYAVERLFPKAAQYYRDAEIEMILQRRALHIDRVRKAVILDNDDAIGYDKLILATGTRPRKLVIKNVEMQGVLYLRNIADADAIRSRLTPGTRVIICGGGYIGLELAAAAISMGLKVTILEMAPRILNRVAPPEIAEFYTQLHREKGVEIRTSVTADRIEMQGGIKRVGCSDGSWLEAEMIVAGIGVIPNTELAEAAGLNTHDGIVVDAHCQTSDPDIFAGGDCARSPSMIYERSLRLESVPNALGQAKVIAANLCGKSVEYNEVPWFWSDQYNLKLQIAGIATDCDQVVYRGKPHEHSFAAFYLYRKRLMATYAVNRPQEFMASKLLINQLSLLDVEKLADEKLPIQQIASVR